MSKQLLILLCFITFNSHAQSRTTIVTDDIDNFWQAYDKVTTTKDSTQQYYYINNLFINKGTAGLKAMMEARGYTAQSYINAINEYPEFWQSVRENTHKAKGLGKDIENGIGRLKNLYPDLKPAKVYFTIGAMRSGGTVYNGQVLIGTEIALTDSNTVSREFPAEFAAARRTYFDSNPINDVVILNIHEYVHTQQKPLVHNLLSSVLYEGVAEFVSAIAMGQQSPTPAVQFGKKNPAVKAKFEQEMFNFRMTDKWLWSDVANEFNTRDMGYYIGYAICEKYYNNAADKLLAIKKMIELDYKNEAEIEEFVNSTRFFSASISELYQKYENARPVVTKVTGIDNNSTAVVPGVKQITVTFSKTMDKNHRNFEYGPLGEDYVLMIQKVIGFSDDGKSITFEVQLLPGKHYQLTVSNGFRDASGFLLKPYLIDITTSAKY
jgi:hypothetical protein